MKRLKQEDSFRVGQDVENFKNIKNEIEQLRKADLNADTSPVKTYFDPSKIIKKD